MWRDALLDALDQVGCRYLVHVRAADAIVENNRVSGMVIATKRGLMTIRAKAVVDCTGDADVSYYASAETMKDTTLTNMKVHDVPFRALLPEKLDGLLCAGRCISATHMGAAAGKSMGNCMATGHAAGLAAAMAGARNILPRELNVRALQDALRADGVNLELKDREQKNL